MDTDPPSQAGEEIETLERHLNLLRGCLSGVWTSVSVSVYQFLPIRYLWIGRPRGNYGA